MELSRSPILPWWDRGFESAFLQQPVCLTSELWTLWAKGAAFAASLRTQRDVRMDALAASRPSLAVFLCRALMQSHFGKLRPIASDAQTAAMVTA